MSLVAKLATFFRGAANEPIEKFLDANAISIFEQEIREAQTVITTAKAHLVAVVTEKKKLEASNETLRETTQRRIVQIHQALEKGREDLARELSDIVAESEATLDEQMMHEAKLAAKEAALKKQLRAAVTELQRYQRELNLAKANRHAVMALSKIKGQSSGLAETLNGLEDSLKKVVDQQANFDAFNAASEEVNGELSGQSLEARLKENNISTAKKCGKDVLERIKAERAKEQTTVTPGANEMADRSVS